MPSLITGVEMPGQISQPAPGVVSTLSVVWQGVSQTYMLSSHVFPLVFYMATPCNTIESVGYLGYLGVVCSQGCIGFHR